MDFATYLEVVTEFNPPVEELGPLHELLQMRMNNQLSDDELLEMLNAFNAEILHPAAPISFVQFKQNFLAKNKLFYVLLDAKFCEKEVTSNFKLAFLSLMSSQCTLPYLTQDNFVKFILALSKPSEFTNSNELIEASAELLQACNAVEGCVSAGEFLEFLLDEKLDDRALRALELECQQLNIKEVGDILKATVPDAKSRELIEKAALLRAGAPLDSNLANKLKQICKQNKCSQEGINEFLIELREEYDRALRQSDVDQIAEPQNVDEASCNIDALILAAEWIPIDIGVQSEPEEVETPENEPYDVGDDKKVMELQKQLKQMRRHSEK